MVGLILEQNGEASGELGRMKLSGWLSARSAIGRLRLTIADLPELWRSMPRPELPSLDSSKLYRASL
jgi:hypothetical protein